MGDGSDGQIESLEALRAGDLGTLCVVDMFNEGLDIPNVDRVVTLRPTPWVLWKLMHAERSEHFAECQRFGLESAG